jgi:ribosomal protein S18 acetylase RimI-like enzyme
MSAGDAVTCSIRAAREEDAPALGAGAREIARIPGRLAPRPDEIDDEAIRGKIRRLGAGGQGLYLVAEDGGRLVGHALLERHALAVISHVAALSLAVHEGSQRRGIGRKLMNELLRWARASPDVEKIELHVRSGNHGALALYQSLGFAEEGRKTRRLKLGPGDYLDDVYMALWVGPDEPGAR